MFIMDKAAPSGKEIGLLGSAQQCLYRAKKQSNPTYNQWRDELASVMKPREEFAPRGKEKKYHSPWVWEPSTKKCL